MAEPLIVPASVSDYRRLARRRLPRFLFDFIDGAANDELTAGRNVEDFGAVFLRQRVLRDVSGSSTATTLFGQDAAMPLCLAPVGMTGLFARRGEVQAKRAADAAGVPYILSTMSICSMEEVAKASPVPFWFQLYMMRDRAVVRELLERARNLKVRTLVFTVDLPVTGSRRRDLRNGIAGGASSLGRLRSIPLMTALRPHWAYDVGLRGRPMSYGNIAEYVPGAADQAAIRVWSARQLDSSVTWADIEWLRGVWDGDLVIKGLLAPVDACTAASVGAQGIVVSNHGGRQLDGAASTISVLPRIADALAGQAAILLDGGIRSGTDIVRAVALGARGVLIGRPYAYALGGAGQAGVEALLNSFGSELSVAMALCGLTNTSEISCDCLERFPDEWLPDRATPTFAINSAARRFARPETVRTQENRGS